MVLYSCMRLSTLRRLNMSYCQRTFQSLCLFVYKTAIRDVHRCLSVAISSKDPEVFTCSSPLFTIVLAGVRHHVDVGTRWLNCHGSVGQLWLEFNLSRAGHCSVYMRRLHSRPLLLFFPHFEFDAAYCDCMIPYDVHMSNNVIYVVVSRVLVLCNQGSSYSRYTSLSLPRHVASASKASIRGYIYIHSYDQFRSSMQ